MTHTQLSVLYGPHSPRENRREREMPSSVFVKTAKGKIVSALYVATDDYLRSLPCKDRKER